MCRWVLKMLGVWPLVYNRTSKFEKFFSFVILITFLSNLMIALIPPFRYVLFVEKNLYIRVKLIGPVGFCLLSTIKYLYLVVKGTVFRHCIAHVENDWKMVDNARNRTIMLKHSNISRKLITLCAAFLYTGGVSYNTVSQFLSKGRVKGNTTSRPLTYPGYDAFLDVQSSPNYEIIYSIQCLAAFIRYTVTTATFSLAVIFVTHICGQIQVQIARLEDFVEKKNEKESRLKLLDIVIRDHGEILR